MNNYIKDDETWVRACAIFDIWLHLCDLNWSSSKYQNIGEFIFSQLVHALVLKHMQCISSSFTWFALNLEVFLLISTCFLSVCLWVFCFCFVFGLLFFFCLCLFVFYFCMFVCLVFCFLRFFFFFPCFGLFSVFGLLFCLFLCALVCFLYCFVLLLSPLPSISSLSALTCW